MAVDTETLIDFETIVGSEAQAACEGGLVPPCTCGMDCTDCDNPAEFAAVNDCGCTYLLCARCRGQIAHHFRSHDGQPILWPCTKCHSMVTGTLSRWRSI